MMIKRTSTNKIKNNKITLETTNRLTLIDYDKAKSQILQELYYSSEFKTKLRKVVKDSGYSNLKNNLEDIKQEVFVELGKKDSEYLFKEYVKSPGRIMALAITIGKSFFRINPKYPDYPNKSIVHKLNYHSTASNRADYISPVDISWDEDGEKMDACVVLVDEEDSRLLNEEFTVEEKSINTLDKVRSKLTAKENKSLTTLLKYFNTVKTIKTDVKAYVKLMNTHKDLLDKIKTLLKEEGVTDLATLFNK